MVGVVLDWEAHQRWIGGHRVHPLRAAGWMVAFTLCFGLTVPRARAQSVDPAIYIDVDLSGSMLLDVAGANYCYGDGSAEHPEASGCTSRIRIAKDAMTTAVSGYPEVRWGLARFKQNTASQYLCFCTTQGDVDPSEQPDSCNAMGGLNYNANMTHDLPGTTDRVCVNYGGSFGNCNGGLTCCDAFDKSEDMAGADILVSLAANPLPPHPHLHLRSQSAGALTQSGMDFVPPAV